MKILMKTNIPAIGNALAKLKVVFSGISGKGGTAQQKSTKSSASGDASDKLDRIILRRQQGAVIKNGYVSLFLRITVIAVIAWLLFTQMFLLTQVSGNSMFPAMKDGDLVIAFRLQESYVKGDVIVYEHDGEMRVGRIVAREADVIDINSNGAITVNGTVQSGEIMYPTYAKEGIEYPFTVPENSVFVMGDYRTQSEDSRDFGAVSDEVITGKVITILRRRSL